MDKDLEAWLQECIGKGTFENREDALEFCVGAVRAYCVMNNLNSTLWRDNAEAKKGLGDEPIPIKWDVWGPVLNAAAKDFDKVLLNLRLF